MGFQRLQALGVRFDPDASRRIPVSLSSNTRFSRRLTSRCVFYGDLYGCGGENPQEPVSQLDDLIRCRKLFAYGELVDHWDHPNCVAWLRKGDDEHDGSVTIICNGKEDGSKRIEVGKDHAGEKWTDVLGWHQGEVTIDEGE